MDWTRLPDVAAVALLTCAFASAAKRGQTPDSGVWLLAWLMIVVHFASDLFQNLPGTAGNLAGLIGLCSLVWAGALFAWATVPYRKKSSSRWMFGVLVFTNGLYLAIAVFAPHAAIALTVAAALYCVLPLSVTLSAIRRFNDIRRLVIVLIYSALAVFLLIFQNRPSNGLDLAINGILFTTYLICAIDFSLTYWRPSTGAFITITGFFAWASVFIAGPLTDAYLPSLHLESEIWNVPKYLVAVGMILLLLEDQIEHNKYLALHDELTGLPNRRLFHDRLSSAIERARRLGTQSALLLVDLDHFKNVNDTLGHHAGDKVLASVASVLSGRVRRSDTVARTGGDEFSIVLEEPTSREDAERVGNSLIQLLAEPLTVDNQTVTVGASVGLAIFPDDATSAESLCIAADLRMYSEKYGSRDSHPPAPPIKQAFQATGENARSSFATSE